MIIIRYLIRETIKTQLAVLFVLLLVFFSQKFIRVLATATEGGIPASKVLTLVSLYMPSMAMLMLPLSLYIAILITFGRLYAQSEITVMKATGIGNRFLNRSALYLALITGCIAGANALWLVPWSNNEEIKVLEQLEADSGIELLTKGQIQSTPDGKAVIFISDIDSDARELKKIFVAQRTSAGNVRPSVLVAEKGHVAFASDGRQLLSLENGKRYEGEPQSLDHAITQYRHYQILIGQREVKEKKRDWDSVPTQELWNDSSPSAKAELQWRFTMILCIPLMTMVVVPLCAVNPRQGRFAKLFPAILIYLTYFLAISAMRSALESGKEGLQYGLIWINVATFLLALLQLSWDSLWVRKIKWRLRGAHV
ncbi:MAG: LPS export ABC transporter permease LptF [Enterovibrio sp.]